MPKYKLIIPTGLRPSLASYELSAAELLAIHFKSDVEFIPRTNHKTPDFLIDGVKWELKSPTGSGKYNVQHQIKAAVKQSFNVIFDARRSKIRMTKLRNEVNRHFIYTNPVRRLVLVDKSKNVIELSK